MRDERDPHAPELQRSRWSGRVLRDKWHIDGRIARGGVGTVYAATHRKNGNRVAIKMLHPEFSRDADTQSRFLQEGYAANHVNHPGVVRILDDDVSEEGIAFLVMELLEGELLEQRRERKGGTLSLAEVYEIADQLLDVLAAAHEKGIVHRDIKPENLFVTSEGRLKVLDFGFAQMKTGFRREQTATGFLLGTPGFMSPEQAVGDRALIDAQTDLWAVGATLFTLLTGRPVHEGESAAEMLVAAANFPARPLASVQPSVPPRLCQVVDKALAFEKALRWPSARAMQAALQAIPGHEGVGGRFESGHRHVDAAPASNERTLAVDIEELDPDELSDDPSGQWVHEDRTLAVGEGAALPPGALPSITRAVPSPADDERPTLAKASPFDSTMFAGFAAGDVAPPTPIMSARPAVAPMSARPAVAPMSRPGAMVVGDLIGSGTVIMESSPSLPGNARPHHASPVPAPPGFSEPPRSSADVLPRVWTPSSPHVPTGPRSLGTPHAFPIDPNSSGQLQVRPPFASHPDEGRSTDPALRKLAPPPPSTAKRVFVFVAVATFSMAVVVVTGLLILAATD